MSCAMKAALINSKSSHMHIKAALFHSSPVLERKRRNHWDSRFNHFSKRSRRVQAKQTLLRNINAYADFVIQSWKEDFEGGDDPSSSRGPSWFREHYSARGSRRDRNGNEGSRYYHRRDSEFPEDDFDVESIFRSAFGGNRFSYWSFINEENPQWRRSGRYSSYGKSQYWRHESDDEYDSSTESDRSGSDLASHRLALGLRPHGPLKLEEVKIAYRACALKWHPDRHQGSSKVVAEEKFKLCSAAYHSLCDRLA